MRGVDHQQSQSHWADDAIRSELELQMILSDKCRKQASLTMSAVSSMLRQHFPMHSNKSAISLYWRSAKSNQGSLPNQYSGRKTQFDPCISSVTGSIMITTSNSSVKRSGLPTQLLGVRLHTIACSELARVRTELFDCS